MPTIAHNICWIRIAPSEQITPFSPPPPPVQPEVIELTEEEKYALANEAQKAAFVKNTGISSLAAVLIVAFGLTADSPGSVEILSTFCLKWVKSWLDMNTFELKRAKIWLDATIGDDLEAFEQCPILGVDK